jgi:glycosyltransferase involved in cell wall biosynthesis
MKLLVLGSKEYPLGTNRGFDPLPSGGMERYVESLAARLAKHNHVIVITRKFPKTESVERHGKVEVRRVPFIRGFFLRNPSFNFVSFIEALKVDFDVVIANDVIASWAGLLAGRLKGKPVIAVSHGMPSEQGQYNFLVRAALAFLEKVFSLADAAVVHNDSQARKLGLKKYFAVTPGFEPPKAKLYKLGSFRGKKILFVGRLVKTKGLADLITACAGMPFEYTLLVVGDGPDRVEMEKLARDTGVNAIFFGHRSDVQSFYRAADVFVLPSFSESLSYSMLEAMAAGVPCVVSDIGIADKSVAILARPGDPGSIAKGIKAALKDSGMAARARRRVGEMSWERAATKFEKIIKKVAV